jgi:hypothetical protein
MEHRQEMILGNCQMAQALKHRPQLFAGEAVFVQGLDGSDYNLLLRDLFFSAVRTAPDEDHEDNTVVLYLTRSAVTKAKLQAYARENVAPAVEVIVHHYHTFDPAEILNLMADIEDGTRSVRYLIIESICPNVHQGNREQVRELRQAAVKARFLFVASGALSNKANEILRIEVDEQDFLETVRDGSYNRHRMIDTEFDIGFIVAPATYDEEFDQVNAWVAVSKCRTPHPFDRTLVRSSYNLIGL